MTTGSAAAGAYNNRTQAKQRTLIQLGSTSLMGLAAQKGNEGGDNGGISAPFNVQHVAHATYNADTGGLSGLDGALSGMMSPSQLVFGSPIASQARLSLPGYSERIPAVLVHLARSFRNTGGLTTEGVFRIPPSTSEFNDITKALDLGRSLRECDIRDPILVAAIIKYWFRSLPVALLSSIPPETLSSLASLNMGSTETLGTFTVARSNQLIFKGVLFGNRVLPEPTKSVFLWALDLMAYVVTGSAQNRMTPKAVSIVFAPSVYKAPKGTDPFTEMELVKVAGKFIENALIYIQNCDKKAHSRSIFGVETLR